MQEDALEGEETFEGQQRFFHTAAVLAAEGQSSRFALSAARP
jgi:hypothetical protein